MYLFDTNVLSEMRHGVRANRGVRDFFTGLAERGDAGFVSVISIGELRAGVRLLLQRGDRNRGTAIDRWIDTIVTEYVDHLVDFDLDCADFWAYLSTRDRNNVLDNQIAATALVYDLTVVTSNVRHFGGTGVRLVNPFSER